MDQRNDYADRDPSPWSEWLAAVVFPRLLVLAGVAGLIAAVLQVLLPSPGFD